MNISDEPLQKELQSIIRILKREIEQAEYIINLQLNPEIDEEYLKQTLTKIQKETQQTTYNIQPIKTLYKEEGIIPQWRR